MEFWKFIFFLQIYIALRCVSLQNTNILFNRVANNEEMDCKDQIFANKQVFIFNDKIFSPFAWYDVIMISREFSELSEDYRARVVRVV